MNKVFGVGTALLSLVLAGCVTMDHEKIGPFPLDWKQIIVSYAIDNFYDPGSIRDAQVSYPQEGHIFFQQGWIVCVKANAKNRMGGYVGRQNTAYLINNDRIVQTLEKAAFCDGAAYTNFEELNNL